MDNRSNPARISTQRAQNHSSKGMPSSSNKTMESAVDDPTASAHGVSTHLKLVSTEGSMKNRNGNGSRQRIALPLSLPQRQASCNLDATHGVQANGMRTRGELDTENLVPLNQRGPRALPLGEIPKGILSIVKSGIGYPGYQTDEKQQSDQERLSLSDPHSAVTVAITSPSIRTPGYQSATPARNADQLRKARISRAVKALQELVPNSQTTKETFLDEVIGYVKFLQLQLQVLSMSRLDGEAVIDDLLHLEGYGHFLPNQQPMKGSLDEMIGNLMDSDMLMAIQLLETKGLRFMPMSLVESTYSG